MKVAMIFGSRNPKGQTARAGKALAEGLDEAGAECEQVFLPQLTLERCRQCDEGGWGICRTEGRCVIEDDLADLLARIQQADAAVFATPVTSVTSVNRCGPSSTA